jgi:hypothetical protein
MPVPPEARLATVTRFSPTLKLALCEYTECDTLQPAQPGPDLLAGRGVEADLRAMPLVDRSTAGTGGSELELGGVTRDAGGTARWCGWGVRHDLPAGRGCRSPW